MASSEKLNYSAILASESDEQSVLFVLFIPSKDKDGNDLADQDIWANAAADKFTRAYGGATIMPPATGKWYNDKTDEIITESVLLIHSYAAPNAVTEEFISEIAAFCHRMGKETHQGEVAMLIDGVFHRMREFGSAD